ncbi:MAG: hypothetical protein LKF61_02450 [Eggerthellaceae bacterium]|jgi:hypothetical protein|nr:hypothetical protein [Eggerthellaceae bacterium]MCH4220813.1 hypothetical protein [Eggerthellaceae bacterium]
MIEIHSDGVALDESSDASTTVHTSTRGNTHRAKKQSQARQRARSQRDARHDAEFSSTHLDSADSKPISDSASARSSFDADPTMNLAAIERDLDTVVELDMTADADQEDHDSPAKVDDQQALQRQQLRDRLAQVDFSQPSSVVRMVSDTDRTVVLCNDDSIDMDDSPSHEDDQSPIMLIGTPSEETAVLCMTQTTGVLAPMKKDDPALRAKHAPDLSGFSKRGHSVGWESDNGDPIIPVDRGQRVMSYSQTGARRSARSSLEVAAQVRRGKQQDQQFEQMKQPVSSTRPIGHHGRVEQVHTVPRSTVALIVGLSIVCVILLIALLLVIRRSI